MKGRTFLRKYINQGLNEAERHQMERLALDDDFLADAWEGLQSADQSAHKKVLARLESSIASESIAPAGKVVSLRRYISMAIAASVAIVLASVIFLRPDTDVLEAGQEAIALSPFEGIEREAGEISEEEVQVTLEEPAIAKAAEQMDQKTREGTPFPKEEITPAIAQTNTNDPLSSAEPVEEAVVALQTDEPINAGAIVIKDGTKTTGETTQVAEESAPIAFNQTATSNFRIAPANALASARDTQSPLFKKLKGEKLTFEQIEKEIGTESIMANQSESIPIAFDDPLKEAKEALNQKNYKKSRQLTYDYLQSNPKSGEAMAFLGDIYAIGASTCGDKWTRSLAVLAAMDKWKASQRMVISRQTAKHVKNQIVAYRDNLPKKDAGFMRGVKAGETLDVSCWVEERVVVRFRD